MNSPVSFIPEVVLNDLNESVWLANVETFETLVLNNVSKTPYHNFVLSASETQEVRSKAYPWVLCHTHVHPHSLSSFSIEDNNQIDKLPLLGHFVYNKLTGENAFFKSQLEELMQDFIGREWDWSRRNCYTLVRDWYLRNFQVYLPHTYLQYEYEYRFDQLWDKFTESLDVFNFSTVSNPNDYRTGDLVLLRIGKTYNPNHIALLIVEDGEPLKLLHHASGRLSGVEVYSQLLKNLTVSVKRYGK